MGASTSQRFSATFSQAFIDPSLVGVTSSAWSGSLNALLVRNGVPQGDWTFHAPTTEVPEPSTMALMGPLVVGLWLWRRQNGLTRPKNRRPKDRA